VLKQDAGARLSEKPMWYSWVNFVLEDFRGMAMQAADTRHFREHQAIGSGMVRTGSECQNGIRSNMGKFL
jgi:hypothetical protein